MINNKIKKKSEFKSFLEFKKKCFQTYIKKNKNLRNLQKNRGDMIYGNCLKKDLKILIKEK